MTDPTLSPEMRSRLAQLSPERRVLLEQKLRAMAASDAPAAPAPSEHIPRRAPDAEVPLTPAQETLWELDQAVADLVAYNVPRVLRVRGSFDVVAWQRALDALVVRHEALRTRFVSATGAARAVVAPPEPVQMALVDLRAQPEGQREEQIREAVVARTRERFDLGREQLLRATVIRVRDDDWVAVLVTHHIVCDESSRNVTYRELGQLYAAFVAGATPALAPLPLQFGDYAVWQRDAMDRGELAGQLAYWREELAQLPVLDLPTDRSRAGTPSFDGARRRFVLPLDVLTRVRALARAHDATMNMVLLAAYFAVLARHSQQDDVVVGSPSTGRRLVELEGLIGYFPNVMVLRSRLADDPTFAELIGRTRQTCLAAFENQDVPLEKIALDLRRAGQLNQAPLFNVGLAMIGADPETLSLPGATVEPLYTDFATAKFDILLGASEQPDGLHVVLEYRTALFDAATIDRFYGHFGTVLGAAAADPGLRLSRLPLLTPAEVTEQLVTWNATDAAWPHDATIHGLFEAQVRAHADRVAVSCGDVHLTYAELDRRANRVAWRLRARGVTPDALVAVCMDKTADAITVLLGILKAGGAYVPVDPAYPDDRIAFMLEDSESRWVITEPDIAGRLAGMGAGMLLAEPLWAPDASVRDDAPPASAQAGNLCYVIYTSGSTGRPKGVLIEHRNVVRLLVNDRLQFTFGPADVWSVFHSFSFDFSVWEMYGALLFGGRAVVVPRAVAQNGGDFLALLEREQVTVLNMVPSAFYALLPEAIGGAPRRLAVRYVIFGGEALQPALLRDWQARYPAVTLVNMFGITETTVHVTFKVIGAAEIANGVSVIGGPIPTLSLYTLDDHLQLVPVGVRGELCVGGAGVARGYLKRPELTAERFVPHPFRPGERLYRSGDLARRRATGEVEYLGRRDAQVKIRGFRIELGEIEAALAAHPAIRESAVMAHTNEDGDSRLVAYVVADDAGPAGDAGGVELLASVFDTACTGVTEGAAAIEPGFNISGWNSMYDKRPIPVAEMREWVETTVDRILAGKPKRVLDLGVGTGLLLVRIAPHVDDYRALGISELGLEALRRDPAFAPVSRNVTLRLGAAHDTESYADGSVDTVIINSVAQYFPDVANLVQVLERAVRVLAPGGRIFLADLRLLPLLETLHTSIALFNAADDTSAVDLRARVRQRLRQETELVVDPAFFDALRLHLPRIARVTVSPKRGRADNELTRFRLDVVIELDAVQGALGAAAPPATVATLDEVRALLVGEPSVVRLVDMVDARLFGELNAQALVSSAPALRTVAEIRAEIAQAPVRGIHPEALASLDDRYEVELRWPASGTIGRFDAELRHRTRATIGPLPAIAPMGASLPWGEFVHHAQPDAFDPDQLLAFRRHLGGSLPEYMVPEQFVRMTALPVTASGKVDRKRLVPPAVQRSARSYVAPRTGTEAAIAELWAEILRVDRVGMDDGFLELGGHSLLAMRIVGRVRRERGVSVGLAGLMQGDTVAQFAASVDALQAAPAADEDEDDGLVALSRDRFRRAGVDGAT